MSRAAAVNRLEDHGWEPSATPNVYQVGVGKAKVEARLTELMPSRCGEPDYNPLQDAFAVRLGADFEGPNRYRFGSVLLDANGACRDEGECPECGSTAIVYGAGGGIRDGGEYRFRVPDGKGGWTWCRRCVSEEEMGDIRQRAAAAQAKAGRR